MNLFDELRDIMHSLLAPFQNLADLELFNDVPPTFVDLDERKKTRIRKQKEYRRHMDDKHMIKFKQSKGPKVIPRDRPYQRRNY